jgi:hypothetical protein
MSAYRAAHVEREALFRDKKIIEENIIYEVRTGYDLGGEKMNVFNEALTESITQEIFKKNIDQLDIESDDFDKAENKSYLDEIEIFNIIIDNLSEGLGEERDETLKRIKKGYFDGSMMHLRLIEKVYGRGFLKFISLFEFIFDKTDLTMEEIKEVFKIRDEKKRNEYLEKIIKSKEDGRRKYKDFLIKLKTLEKK